MRVLRIGIVEDIKADAERLRLLTDESEFPAVVHIYRDPGSFLQAFVPDFFHLIFLDIYMEGEETPYGVELAKKIRKWDENVRIVFTTSSLDHALDGYAVKASQYLVKPVQKEDVDAMLLNAAKYWEAQNDSITVTLNRQQTSIRTNEILYIEVLGKQSVIHMLTQNISLYIALDELEKQLKSPPFLRCHRSFIVNLDHVTGIDRDFTVSNGDTVYIRRQDTWKMKKAYQDYVMSLTWAD
ncbi:DNA-binding response regulator [Clostridia bacterium]|nr:DNA-binding response regulator [Clostridia bacterium]